MVLYSENKEYKLYQGSMLDMLDFIEPNSIDSIITDPPYGLTSITKRFGKENSAECQYGKDGSFARLSRGFMGKEWDGSGIEYNIDTWKKCYEVLKPGGYLLAFGGSRTFHRIACAIEDAGFEIRDTIMWLYGSGFPKSMNVGLAIDKKNGVESKIIGKRSEQLLKSMQKFKEQDGRKHKEDFSNDGYIKEATNEWQGWGTCLKPSFEPIIVARKPFKGSLVDNVIEYGVGGINIDECRVYRNKEDTSGWSKAPGKASGFAPGDDSKMDYTKPREQKPDNELGRFPANTILTYDETDFDEVCGGFPNTSGGSYRKVARKRTGFKISGSENNIQEANSPDNYGDSGSASRYFYCAKASKKDRDEGLDEFEEVDTTELLNRKPNTAGILWEQGGTNAFSGAGGIKKNTHPTVKPTELMQYLVRLVSPKGATILDPFNGSGSTGKAVMFENKERDANYKYIGIDLSEEYLEISKARIEYVCNLQEEKDPNMTIFDFIGDD